MDTGQRGTCGASIAGLARQDCSSRHLSGHLCSSPPLPSLPALRVKGLTSCPPQEHGIGLEKVVRSGNRELDHKELTPVIACGAPPAWPLQPFEQEALHSRPWRPRHMCVNLSIRDILGARAAREPGTRPVLNLELQVGGGGASWLLRSPWSVSQRAGAFQRPLHQA